ncbi:MAG: hypothetical protein AAF564_19045 [Bacteroidota bacterium]
MLDGIRSLIRLQLLMIVVFVLGKMVLRPAVLKRDAPTWLDIFVLSFPNFCEAIVGAATVTGLLLMFNARFVSAKRRLSERVVYAWAIVFTGIYVILQEFKVHNLGGANIYDPYDILFSLIGLVVAWFIINRLRPSFSIVSART